MMDRIDGAHSVRNGGSYFLGSFQPDTWGRWLSYTIIFSYFLVPYRLPGVGLAIHSMLIPAAFLLMAWSMAKGYRTKQENRPLFWKFTLILSFYGISLLIAYLVNMETAKLEVLRGYLLAIGGALAIAWFFRHRDLLLLRKCAVAYLLVASALNILQIVYGESFYISRYLGREVEVAYATGFTYHSSVNAALVGFLIPFVILSATKKDSTWRNMGFILSIPLFAFGLYFSFSVAAWMGSMFGMALGMIFLLKASDWKLKPVRLPLLGAVLYLGLLGMLFVNPGLLTPLKSLIANEKQQSILTVADKKNFAMLGNTRALLKNHEEQTENQDERPEIAPSEQKISSSWATRYVLLMGLAEEIQKNPWFGMGFGNFGEFYRNYVQKYGRSLVVDHRQTIPAHQTFLRLWAEAGIFPFVGLILLFVWLMYKVYQAVFRKEHRHSPIIIGLSMGVLVVLFDSLFHDLLAERIFWIPVSLLLVSLEQAAFGSNGNLQSDS